MGIRIPLNHICDRNWEFFGVPFYSLCSQHVSAPTGHPQVKYNYVTYFEKAINTTTDPLFYNCSLNVSVVVFMAFSKK
jgi:hypothetical protein